MKTYPAHDPGNLLCGRVVAVDDAARTVILTDAISSPGEGVGFDIGPGPFAIALNDDAAMPAVGIHIAAHVADGWWIDAPDLGPPMDIEQHLAETAEQLDGMIQRFSALRERYDESTAVHDFLSNLIHHLVLAHTASVSFGDDDGGIEYNALLDGEYN